MNWRSFVFGILCLATLVVLALVIRDAMALRPLQGALAPQVFEPIPQVIEPIPQVIELPQVPVYGGVNDGSDPNVGGGSPDSAGGMVVDLVPELPKLQMPQTAVDTFSPSAAECDGVLWSNELPAAGCFGRWKWQRERGEMSQLDLYLASAPANCQKLADAQEDNCLFAVDVTTSYIIKQMENR